MLRTAEDGMKGKSVPSVSQPVLAIGGGKEKKRKGPPNQNWKEKVRVRSSINGPRPRSSSVPHNANPKEADCFYCKEKGHWKRSCPKYLQDLKDGKVKPSTAGPKGKQGGHSVNYIDSSSGVEKACLWHCRIGHINKKHTQLQTDGVLESFDLKSDDVCESCLLGKMTKSPFKGSFERGEGLLDIIHTDLSAHRTPQLNGVAERHNRTLLDMVRSMMSRASLPINFWGYALETAAHILNLFLTKKVAKTPHEMWTGKVPSLAHINVWGCEAFVRRETHDKLAKRSERCIFIGYPKQSFGYLFYRPSKDVFFIARRGVFRERERELIFKEDSGSTIGLEEIQELSDNATLGETSNQQEEEVPVGPTDISLPLRRSSRVSMPPKFYGFHITTDGDTFVSDRTLINLDEPANYREAVAGPESTKWKEAMDSEIKSMYKNLVWNLVDNVPGRKTVGYKWIFKKKTDMDGNVHTFKARLVAKGFTQTPGIDYDDTFSPVTKIKSIRIMLAIAAFHDYEIWQMDVKTAFLNGKLTEDVYMNQPEGFVDAKYPNKVCKLEKSIYGLKQASRSWNVCFHEKVKEFGFSRSKDESCVYVKASGSIVTFLVLYVDDIMLMGNDIPTLQDVKSWLGKCLAMKDLGESPSTDEEIADMSRVPYASAMGSIMYAVTYTQPDVAFALSMVSRYQGNPGRAHWTAVKNILKYLRRTKNFVLILGGSDTLRVDGYTNASFQTDRDNGRSQSGWVFLLNGGAVTWKSSKQETVADSTCESEYIAASEAAKEAAWLKNFIGDLGVVPSIQEPVELFCDNEGAVALTKEPRDHGKSGHIDSKYHYIRHRVEEGHLLVKSVSSEDNSADPLTKALSRIKHNQHARRI
ncbi:hypothetical protein L2E82_04605 [Cichorium intybus]|uniref:Uncharacterized protein n=1 Tax=Cichorium intybus TaxID=13427 RepID=A0ACB9H6R3_CICIN|nr:hypothetical protein L2E82_04605 [Cichorium intybus]